MGLISTFIALSLFAGLSISVSARDETPLAHSSRTSTSSNGAKRTEDQASLDALRERSQYALLGKQAVETVARAAKAQWPQVLSGFTYKKTEHFSAGGAEHWISIWSHHKSGLEFALVPGGKFQMGSPPDEANRNDDELQHWVTLDPFLIARTECTQGAWAKLATAAKVGGDTFEGSAALPKAGMSPGDVEAWRLAARLSLPTEAQWEFMCRAGTTSPWTMGTNKQDLKRFANIGSAECPQDWTSMPGITEAWHDGYGAQTSPVGSFAPNAFGLFDVHGNVSEWSRDHYFSNEVPFEKGTGNRPGTSGERIARGGNFGGNATFARPALRFKCDPGISPGSNHGFGVRPALGLSF